MLSTWEYQQKQSECGKNTGCVSSGAKNLIFQLSIILNLANCKKALKKHNFSVHVLDIVPLKEI